MQKQKVRNIDGEKHFFVDAHLVDEPPPKKERKPFTGIRRRRAPALLTPATSVWWLLSMFAASGQNQTIMLGVWLNWMGAKASGRWAEVQIINYTYGKVHGGRGGHFQ